MTNALRHFISTDTQYLALSTDTQYLALNWYPVSGLRVFSAYSFGESVAGTGLLANNSRGPFAATGPEGSFTAGENVDFDPFLIGVRRNF